MDDARSLEVSGAHNAAKEADQAAENEAAELENELSQHVSEGDRPALRDAIRNAHAAYLAAESQDSLRACLVRELSAAGLLQCLMPEGASVDTQRCSPDTDGRPHED